MGEVTLEFVGEHLLRLVDSQRRIERTLDDMFGRLQSLENNYVGLRREMVDMHADIIRMDHRLDGFDQRLNRIERRLDLVDT